MLIGYAIFEAPVHRVTECLANTSFDQKILCIAIRSYLIKKFGNLFSKEYSMTLECIRKFTERVYSSKAEKILY